MDTIIQARIQAYISDPSDERAHALASAAVRSEGSDMATRKVVVSRGYGGGFASSLYVYGAKIVKTVAEFQPLIDATEADDESAQYKAIEMLQDLLADVRDSDGWSVGQSYALSRSSMDPSSFEVVEVTGPYRIKEYDGAEYIETLADAIGHFI